MLTKLGIACASLILASNSPITYMNNDSVNKGTTLFKDTGGVEHYVLVKGVYVTNQLRLSMNDGNGGVAFGSGTSAPTENDYTLESLISSGLTAPTPTQTYYYDAESNRWVTRIEYTISNITEEPITISEMCIYRSMGYSSTAGGSSSGNARFMIDRTVLDEPVTIPGGEAGVIRYDFAFPNANDEPEPEPDPEPDPEPGE